MCSTGERSAASNRLHKILEDANLKLTSVVSDVRGKSAQAMLAALLAGLDHREALADLAKGSLRTKLPELQAALTGRIRAHHLYMLGEVLDHIEELNQRISALDAHIQELTVPHQVLIQRLEMRSLVWIGGPPRCSWPKWGRMSRLSPAASTWLPGRVCAPAITSPVASGVQARFGQGQNWLRPALVEAAWAAARTKTYLGAQYWRLRSRRGEKRAAVAVAHSIITICLSPLARNGKPSSPNWVATTS